MERLQLLLGGAVAVRGSIDKQAFMDEMHRHFDVTMEKYEVVKRRSRLAQHNAPDFADMERRQKEIRRLIMDIVWRVTKIFGMEQQDWVEAANERRRPFKKDSMLLK